MPRRRPKCRAPWYRPTGLPIGAVWRWGSRSPGVPAGARFCRRWRTISCAMLASAPLTTRWSFRSSCWCCPVSSCSSGRGPRAATKAGISKRDASELPGLELGPALRSRQFWTLILVQVFAGVGLGGIFFFTVASLIRAGFSPAHAALAQSCKHLFAVAGIISIGAIADRFTARRVMPFRSSCIGLLGAVFARRA